MREISDEALVLLRRDYSEADRIITFLTRERGKISAIAKGAKKPSSRLGKGTDLFSHCKIRAIQGNGDLFILAGAERVGTALNITDFVLMTEMSAVSETILTMTETGQPIGDAVFNQVLNTFERIGRDKAGPKAVVAFVQTLMKNFGLGLDVLQCVECGEPLQPKPTAVDVDAGGALCGNCSGNLVPLSIPCLKALRLLARGDEETFLRLQLSGREVSQLLAICQRQISGQSGRKLKAFASLIENLAGE